MAFDTPNTKNQPSSNISNLKNFGMELQYALKYESAGTKMPKIYILILFTFSLSSQHISLSLSLFLFHSLPISPKTTTWHCWSSCQDRIPCHTTLLSSYTIHHATPRNDTPHSTTPRHTTPTCHRNLPPLDLSQSAYNGGFCFWVCLICDGFWGLWIWWWLLGGWGSYLLGCYGFFFLSRCWWMWVCVVGGCRCCCDNGGCGFLWFGMGFEICECGGLLWIFFFLVFFFSFSFKVAWVDMGLCRWWLSMLLQQWLLVVLRQWWLCCCCCW